MNLANVVFKTLFSEPVRNGIYKSTEFQGHGVLLVKMNQLFSERRLRSQTKGYDRIELSDDELLSRLLQKNDLLFSRTSIVADGVGKCSLVAEVDENLTWDSNIIRVRLNSEVADPEYYFYYFNAPAGRDTVKRLSSGAAVTTITGSGLASSTVPCPSLLVQRRIAGILSSYDELIENNQRRIGILETMARSLYREWFVNFRFPGHEKGKRVSSALGQIPEGWKISTFDELYSTSSGGTPSRQQPEYFLNGTIEWVKSQELQDGFVLCTSERITEEALRKSSAKVFPAQTVLIALYGATIGKLAILSRPAATNQACCAVLPRCAPFAREFAYLTLLQNRERIIGLRLGAAQQNISQLLLKKLECIRPPDHLVLKLSDTLRPAFDLILTLQLQIRNLRQTRDLLLPRLLSGELAAAHTA